MIKTLIYFFLSYTCYAYDIAIVGASGRLGRELVYQSTKNMNKKVIGYTSNPHYIYEPYRANGYNEENKGIEYKSSNLDLYNYWKPLNQDYEHLIFCTSAMPFEDDYSDKLFNKFFNQISNKCKSISFVSANGVGDTLENSNIGIKIMNNWYLKDVYRAKNKIEDILIKYNGPMEIYIYRPRALSHGDTMLSSVSRKNMAKTILQNLIKD
jgi:hypothetical protein